MKLEDTLAYKIEELWLACPEKESWQFAERIAAALKVSTHHVYGLLTNLVICVNPLNEK